VLRIVPNAGLKWALYDRIKKLSMPQGRAHYSGGDLWLRSVVAGSLSGGFTQLILYPMDFARTRLAADMSAKGEERRYRGFLHCLRTITRHQGVRAVYAGLTPSLLGYMPYVGIKFSTYELMRAWLFPDAASHNSPWFPLQMMLIGATAGLVSKTAAYPMDTIRVRMQLHGTRYHGMQDCIRSIYRSEGRVVCVCVGE
jgi:Mitochondrial carrier protein